MLSEIPFILQNFLDTEGGDILIETLHSGHINHTFKVCLPDGSAYILQNINTAVFQYPDRIMANVEIVAQHLQAKAYPQAILQFLKTKTGDRFFEMPKAVAQNGVSKGTEKQVWRLCPFIPNTYSILTAASPQQAFDAAAAFGAYFAYLSDLDTSKIQTVIPNFHNPDFRIQEYRTAFLQKETPSLERLQKAASALALVEQHLGLFEHRRYGLPKRIAHNDTKISNLLFDSGTHKPISVIDLDTVQVETVLSEFGDMLRSYTPSFDEDEPDAQKVTMRFEYFEAVASGFLSETTAILTPVEKSLLVYGGLRTVFVQALRFLTDYLNHDIYYKTHYADHNLVRAKNQFALFQSILKQQKQMETFINRFVSSV
jgi:thiamine kinase-like enzyme